MFRFCEYPQSLTFQFEGDVRIRKIKFLSHQYKISKKIEIFIGQMDQPAEQITGEVRHNKCDFKRIGYLSLDSNQSSDYKARELKKVKLDVTCCFVRLTLHRNHINTKNLYNQVGLIGVQFIGEVVSQFPAKVLGPLIAETPKQLVELEDMTPPKSNEDLQDLDLDPNTQQELNKLYFFKQKAAQNEDFVEAQRIKEKIDHIKRVSAQLRELERQKHSAVIKEDFQRAAKIKTKIDELKNSGPISPREQEFMAGVRPRSHSPSREQRDRPRSGENEKTKSRDTSPSRDKVVLPDINKNRNHDDIPIRAPRTSEVETLEEKPIRLRQQPSQPQEEEEQEQEPVEEEKPRRKKSVAKKTRVPSANGEEPRGRNKNEEEPRGRNRNEEEEQHEPSSENTKVPYDERPAKSKSGGVGANYDDQPVTSIDHDYDNAVDSFREPTLVEDNSANKKRPARKKQPTNNDEVKIKKKAEDEGGVQDISDLPEWEQTLIRQIRQMVNDADHPEDLPKTDDVFQTSAALGEYVTQCLYSVNIRSFREAAVKVVTDNMDQVPATKRVLMISLCRYLRHGLKDKITQVYFACIHMFEKLLTVCDKVKRKDMQPFVEPVLAALFEKTKDTNQKIHNAAIDSLLYAATSHVIGPTLVSQMCVKIPHEKDDKKTISRPLLSRLVMLQRLVGEYGFEKSGITPTDVMKLCKIGFDNSSGEVRTAAFTLTESVYRASDRDKSTVRKYYNHLEKSKKVLFEQLEEMLLAVDAEEQSNEQYKPEAQNEQQEEKQQNDQESNENYCEFCRAGPFPDEQQIDMHLVVECPWLAQCLLCEQMITIPEMNEHMKGSECEKASEGKTCQRCGLVVPKSKYDQHVQSKACKPRKPASQANRCPVCGEDTPPGIEGMQKHILEPPGCPMKHLNRQAMEEANAAMEQQRQEEEKQAKSARKKPK
jgi:hypothetical protein